MIETYLAKWSSSENMCNKGNFASFVALIESFSIQRKIKKIHFAERIIFAPAKETDQ